MSLVVKPDFNQTSPFDEEMFQYFFLFVHLHFIKQEVLDVFPGRIGNLLEKKNRKSKVTFTLATVKWQCNLAKKAMIVIRGTASNNIFYTVEVATLLPAPCTTNVLRS
jgi:hypothetical protein